MRHLILTLIISLLAGTLSASKAVVSIDYGFDAVNGGGFIQQAFNSFSDTVIIDYTGSPWRTGPLKINRNDLVVIFERGVILEAIPNEFGTFESLLQIDNQNSISILGNGATLRMNRAEYAQINDGEYRHAIRLGSCSDMEITGLHIIESGGDGIYVGEDLVQGNAQNFCRDIYIHDCIIEDHYRQGISIISAKNLLIERCEISGTRGTLPEDGIDIEPFEIDQPIENVRIVDCYIHHNSGHGLSLALWEMDDSSPDVSVEVLRTRFQANHAPDNVYAYCEIACTDNNGNGVDGIVRFAHCLIDSSQWTGLYVAKGVDSYDIQVDSCIFKQVSMLDTPFNAPIFFEVSNYDDQAPRFGGARFTDCSVIYNQAIPCFDIFENLGTSDGLGQVSGNFFVFNPNADSLNAAQTGTNPDQVQLALQRATSFPTVNLELAQVQTDYLESTPAIPWVATLQNGPLSYPVSFNYLRVESGSSPSAAILEDYGYDKGFGIIPPNATQYEGNIRGYADTLAEGAEHVVLHFPQNACQAITGADELNFVLLDSLLANSIPAWEAGISIGPNPAQSYFSIHTKTHHQVEYWVLVDINGKMVDQKREVSPGIWDVSTLASGTYFLFGLRKGLAAFYTKLQVNP
ncbi:MAG: right-handed parallel beta-helix repeat-containing protein [Bacteroidota bacterium]